MEMVTDDIKLSPAELASVNAAYWAWRSKIKVQAGEFTLTNHEYLTEVMSTSCKRVCVLKGTQGGFTLAMTLVSLHGMITRKYPLGVMYLFPTSDDVGDFSKSRFDPLIKENAEAIGRYVQDTDTTHLKRVCDSFLFLRGARLTQKIEEDSKEASKLRSISVDRVIFDEYDLMDQDSAAKARGRMSHSMVAEEAFLSNPTMPDFGISKAFNISDQRHWFRRCLCGSWTCAELEFPGCIHLYKSGETPGRFKGYIACNKCGKVLSIAPGEWVPQIRDNTEYMRGYRWSQLTSAFVDPADLLKEYNDPPEGNLSDFYRLRLGLPHAASDDRLQESQVYSCCGANLPLDSHRGPCAMGVDVGKKKHAVIGIRVGSEQYEVIRTISVDDWNDLHDLARRFNVKSAVVDIRPYEDSARDFQKKEPYPIYLCQYSETMSSGPQYDPNNGLVKVNRTEMLDRTHRMVVTEGMMRLPRMCPEIREFARQVCNPVRFTQIDKKTGVPISRYRAVGDGQDHYRHALGYFFLAASGGKIARITTEDGMNRPRRATNNFRAR